MIRTPVAEHDIIIGPSSADRKRMLLDLISGAQSSLRIIFYIFEADEIGHIVRDALLAARARGVDVRLIVDGFGSANTPDIFFKPLIDSGAKFARFHQSWGRSYLLRNHQKLIIADRARALIGGANIADSYFDEAEGPESWRDLFLQINGPVAQRAALYFDALRRWLISERPGIRGLVHILGRRSDAKGHLRWLFGGPFQRLSPLTRQIKHDIDSAQSISMIQAYFSPNWGMLRRLSRVVRRRHGHVSLITAAQSDNGTTIAAARHCYKRLLRNGAEISEFSHQKLHTKLLVIDNVSYIGSANFDMRSLFINVEIMLRIEDEALAGLLRTYINAEAQKCRPITRTAHEAAGVFTRLRWLVAYFLVSTVDFTVTRRFNLRRDRP